MPINRPKSMPERFTLVELLVVVATISLLAAILIPALSAAQERAREASCINNLKNIGQGIAIYGGENRNYLPVYNNPIAAEYPARGHYINGTDSCYKPEDGIAGPVQLLITGNCIGQSDDAPDGRTSTIEVARKYLTCPGDMEYATSAYATSAEYNTSYHFYIHPKLSFWADNYPEGREDYARDMLSGGDTNPNNFIVGDHYPTAYNPTPSVGSWSRFHLNGVNLLHLGGHVNFKPYSVFPIGFGIGVKTTPILDE